MTSVVTALVPLGNLSLGTTAPLIGYSSTNPLDSMSSVGSFWK